MPGKKERLEVVVCDRQGKEIVQKNVAKGRKKNTTRRKEKEGRGKEEGGRHIIIPWVACM